MIDQIDNILYALRNTDSKQPMMAEALAKMLDVSIARFEEMMNVICNLVPAPVNRAYTEKADFKGYVYWPTGIVDKAHWKDFKPASSKPAAQPIRTENSIQKVSTDTYETPVFITKEATDPIADAEPDYSDKPKAYRILKFIESSPGSTSRDIQNAIGLPGPIDGYISPYLEHIEILPKTGGRVFTLKKPVDEFYNHRKVAEKKQTGAKDNEAKPIHKQPQETTAKSALDAQAPAAEPQRDAVHEVQTATVETNQPEVGNDHPAAKVRFAITSDRHMILMGLAAEDIELTEADSHALIKFCGDIALAANVSDALANRMVDLETLGS